MKCERCGFPRTPPARRFRDEREVCPHCDNFLKPDWFHRYPLEFGGIMLWAGILLGLVFALFV